MRQDLTRLDCHGKTKTPAKKPLVTLTPYRSEGVREEHNTYIVVSNNPFFNYGISCALSNINKKPRGLMYFVDFTSDLFEYYLYANWMNDYPAGASLILLTDKRMCALANYWFYHHLPHIKICAVVFDNMQIIYDVLSGSVVYPQRAEIKLSDYEYIILRKICEGVRIKKIAHLINKSPKTIYTFKNRIEAKLLCRIKSLIYI